MGDGSGEIGIYARGVEPPGIPGEVREKRRRRKREERRAHRRRRRKWRVPVLLAFLPGLAALFRIHAIDTEPVERLQAPATAPGAQPVPPFMADSLKTRLRQVALVHPGIQGVVVFEPSSARIVALNEDRPFMAASLAKLPVMLSLYKAAARGELSLEEEISILTSDVQGYGSGVLHSYPAGYTMTLRECASYMIKESDNTAWMRC